MRKSFISAGIAAAIVAGALLGPAGAFASPASRTSTIQVTAHFTKATLVDAGDPGQSAGDQQVVAGILSQGHTQVGRFGFICELLTAGPKANEQCDGTGRLSGGSITVAGFSRISDNDHTWAVVGGTGVYRNATGQARIHDVDDTTSNVTIELG